MKPRIAKLRGLWYCRTPQVTGLGYTPAMAYDDWADLTLTLWRKP